MCGGFPFLYFPTGEFPIPPKRYLGLAPRDEDATLAIFYYGGGYVYHYSQYSPRRPELSKRINACILHVYMKHVAKHTVRSYELDGYNHVNNAIYLNYLEHGRIEYLKAIGFDYPGLVEAGYYLYVTHIDIRYKSSARLFDELSIEVESIKLGRLSGTFRQRIYNQRGETCAEAEVSWGCVDSTGKPSKLPDRFLVPALSPERGDGR